MARPDTEYQVTPKGEEMAKRLAQTRGMKGMMGNKASPSSTAEQTDSRISKTPKKDPNYTTISGGVARPLRQNDTVSDILAKMYNFMRKKYERDLKDAKKEKKYRVSLVKAKENRIEELIKLFKGKYKRKVSKDTKKEKTDQDDKKDKGLFNGVIDKAKQTVQSVKEGAKTIFQKGTSVVNKGVSTVSRAVPSVSTVAKVAVSAGATATAASVIAKEEGVVTKGYWDPPNQKELVSIGYGHQITQEEYKQGFIQAGDEQVPIKGNRGIDTIVSKDQAKKIFERDVPKYEAQAKQAIGPAWSKLNDNQKAAIVDYTYNAGVGSAKKNTGLYRLINEGLVQKIEAGDMQGAAQLIQDKGVKTAKGVENKVLVQRRKNEAALFVTPVEAQKSVTTSAMAAPKETKPIPQQIKPPANNSGSSVMLNTNNTNILNGGTNYSVTQDNVKSTAPLLDLQYN